MTDFGAARLDRRGIDRGPVGRESRPGPRPVTRTTRSQGGKDRVSSRDVSPPLRCRAGGVKQALRQSYPPKKSSVHHIYPMKNNCCIKCSYHEVLNPHSA